MRAYYSLLDSSKLIVWSALVAALVAASTLVAAVVSADTNTPQPSNSERVITIYDKGEKRVILTKATSVEDALNQAAIPLTEHDMVEPARDTRLEATDYTVNIYRARPVLVVDGDKKERVVSPYMSPKEIASSLEAPVYPEDTFTMKPSTDVLTDGAGVRVEIDRAVPVSLILYGKKTTVRTQATTIGDMLREKEITIGKNDRVSVAESTPVKKDMSIRVWREGIQTVTKEESVDFATEQIQDAEKKVGYREVKTAGVKGKKNVTYEILIRDDKEVARKQIASVVTEQPKKEIVVVGAKPEFGGDFASALAKLRSCEGGYDSWNPAGPYYGAYQFDQRTWSSVSSAPYGKATPAEQDAAARALYERRGWQPWPVCGASLPDTYR